MLNRWAENEFERLGMDFLPLLRWRSWMRRKFPRALNENWSTLHGWELMKAIQDVSGCTVIVDSSKNMPRWWHLSADPRIDAYFIHMVRDGRAYIHSRKNRIRFKRFPKFLRPWLRSLIGPFLIKRWIYANLSVDWTLNKDTNTYMLLPYEHLAGEPARALKEVFQHCGLEELNHVEKFRSGHQIAGAHTAYYRSNIKLNEDWRNTLSWWDRLIFCMLGGWLNNRYGYSHKQGASR
jgi:hypothetical protein